MKRLPTWLGILFGLLAGAIGIGIIVVGIAAVVAGVPGAAFTPATTGMMSLMYALATVGVGVAFAALAGLGVWKFLQWVVPSVVQKDRFYPAMFAAVVTVPLAPILNELLHDKVLSAAATVALTILNFVAADVLKHSVYWGIVLYLTLLAGLGGLLAWSEVDVSDWLGDLSREGWAALLSIVLSLLLLAGIVVVAESHYRAATWLTPPWRREPRH